MPIYRDIMLSRTKNEINESSKYRDVARERAEKEVRERKFYERRQLDTLMAKRDQLQRRIIIKTINSTIRRYIRFHIY